MRATVCALLLRLANETTARSSYQRHPLAQVAMRAPSEGARRKRSRRRVQGRGRGGRGKKADGVRGGSGRG